MISTGDGADGPPSLFQIVFLEWKRRKTSSHHRRDKRKVDKHVEKKYLMDR